MTKKTSTTLQITKLIAPLFKYTTGILNLLNTTTYRHCRFTLNSVHLKSTSATSDFLFNWPIFTELHELCFDPHLTN